MSFGRQQRPQQVRLQALLMVLLQALMMVLLWNRAQRAICHTLVQIAHSLKTHVGRRWKLRHRVQCVHRREMRRATLLVTKQLQRSITLLGLQLASVVHPWRGLTKGRTSHRLRPSM